MHLLLEEQLCLNYDTDLGLKRRILFIHWPKVMQYFVKSKINLTIITIFHTFFAIFLLLDLLMGIDYIE